MKLYSKTANQELEVDVMTKEQNGQVLTVIKHASLQDIIYNQLAICKGPENISIDLLSHNPYPVYRCTIWDKERDRYAVGIGSGKPETLAAGIASDYADESASNRAFDRAAITYLQFPGRQLSEGELGFSYQVILFLLLTHLSRMKSSLWLTNQFQQLSLHQSHRPLREISQMR